MRRPAPAKPQVVWPWSDVELTVAEVASLRGLSDTAMAAIEKLAGDRNPFTPGGAEGDRATTFACGKLWLAGAIRNARVRQLPVDPRGPPPPMPGEKGE